MRSAHRLAVVALGALTAPAVVRAQGAYLLIPDSGNDWVSLFDASTGALVQEGWVKYADAGIAGSSTPRAAVQVGREIWVSDQNQDRIFRWQARINSPAYLGAISGAIDGPRGLRVVGSEVYLANSLTGNGAPGEAIIRLDFSGNILGSFPATDPFDVLPYNGSVLVQNITDDNIDRYSVPGVFQGAFHDSDGVTGIDNGQQLNTDAAGRVLAAGFSPPFGIYRYNSTGVQLNFWPVGNGDRGVCELADGNILFTHNTSVSVLNPTTGGETPVFTGASSSMQFIHPATLVCAADYDADGFVTGDDFDAYVAAFEAGDPTADFNGDGFTTGDDFDAYVAAFEAGC